ncbi:ATP-dependent zinc metalloprotease FtsH [Clostridia bacterium]|nr:ATP-dependent zinc metalloprotease FtsH [Clostridia bacterium]
MPNEALGILLFLVLAFSAYFAGARPQRKKERAFESVGTDVSGIEIGTKFADVAGAEEAKESVADVVDFIKSPEKYSAYGARTPRGVIFYGPPGTGKTLLAKAVAGEANVPFFSASGSDFVQMYVGVGAARVRELFAKARKHVSAVIFIDEIDALGKSRGNQGGNDEREQTLNALLTEMSGFNGSDGVVVIAATNRLDTLDSALLRPGRFDRQVEVNLPTAQGRLEILKVHAKNKPMDNVDLAALAKRCVFFSGASLANMLNEAAIFAAKRGEGDISESDVDSAYYAVLAGAAKKDRTGITALDKEITAFHEAGHALAAKIFTPEATVSKVNIIPSTRGAGGFCVNVPAERAHFTKKDAEAQIMVTLAGRAAEELIFGEENISAGASNDLQKTAESLTDYIMKYGMAGLKFAGREMNEAAEREYGALVERFYETAKKALTEDREKLETLAFALIEKESLDEGEVNEIFFG